MSIYWLAILPLLVIVLAIISRRDKALVSSSVPPVEHNFDTHASCIALRASRDPSYLPHN